MIIIPLIIINPIYLGSHTLGNSNSVLPVKNRHCCQLGGTAISITGHSSRYAERPLKPSVEFVK